MIGKIKMKNKNTPKPPMDRVLVESHIKKCPKCGSTTHRSGFLGLFGKTICDNLKCRNNG